MWNFFTCKSAMMLALPTSGALTPAPEPQSEPTPAPAPASWDGDHMKMTHYWDCSGQGCDAATLQPWDTDKYISPPGYAPQDPMDFGGPLYGERMWLTGAASDALSELMGDDDDCCGGDPNDGGIGGCGKCVLVQNPQSLHPDWTAVVMKKNRCPPWSHGCDAGKPHLDIAAPGYDNLQYSTANICGGRPGTGFDSKQQSATLGSWYDQCTDTDECAHLCDTLPAAFRKGCRLFSSWGWKRGDPDAVRYRAVPCPAEFRRHVGSQFGPEGAASAPGPTPPVMPVPTTAPTVDPAPLPTPRPTSGPQPEPAPAPGSCTELWGQCGGQGFSGYTCCEPGGMCTGDQWYKQCVPGVENPRPTPRPTSAPGPVQPTPAPEPQSEPTPAPAPASWDGDHMKMTHYWDCSGQGCDAATLQPWDTDKYISPPGYAPQDPMDFGGPLYGERMWLTGAASDALSELMGDDDDCCGGDPNDGGIGGCGKCVLVQNPQSLHPDWTAVVMKKNRCPPWSHGCDAGKPHLDIAAPGYDNLQYSTANVCGGRPGTGFDSKQQSATLGSWYDQCTDTAKCAHLCDTLPAAFRKGCRLFSSWGWKRGDPDAVRYRAVPCPAEFRRHVGSQFGPDGAAPAHSHLVAAMETVAARGEAPLPLPVHRQGFLTPRFSSSHVTLGSWFMQNESRAVKHVASHHEVDGFSQEL